MEAHSNRTVLALRSVKKPHLRRSLVPDKLSLPWTAVI